MRAIVFCEQCEGTEKAVRSEVEAATLDELGPLLTAVVVSFHSTPPHCPHAMKIAFVDAARPDILLTLRCIDPRCAPNQGREMKTRCPRELIGALTLVFHTSHEGHPIEIEYEGRSWRSPVA